MTDTQIDFCKKQLLSINIRTTVILDEEIAYLEGDLNKHFKCYEDSIILSDASLIWKYFDRNTFPNADFDKNGMFINYMTRATVYKLVFKDFGEIILTDEVNGKVKMWYLDSDLTDEATELFKDSENLVGEIKDYFISLNKEEFKFNSKEAYLSIPEIGMLN